MEKISVVILLVIFCRFFVGRVSKQASYLLWLIVAVRLVCPVTVSSQFSVFNMVNADMFSNIKWEAFVERILFQRETPDMQGSIETDAAENQTTDEGNYAENMKLDIESENAAGQKLIIEEVQNIAGQETTAASEKDMTANPENTWLNGRLSTESAETVVWLFGAGGMLLAGFFSYWHLKYRLRFSTKERTGVFESEQITSPFVLGVIKPVIYLPLHLTEQEKNYILAHERYHIKRKDYLVKLFAYGLLSVYWFHPLVWVSFYLMSQDMEMSCDEQVLKGYTLEERKAYSVLLLNFASGKHVLLPSPVSFGERDVKKRIKQILHYKSPTFWGILAVLSIGAVLTVGCLTDENEDFNYNLTDKQFDSQFTENEVKQWDEKTFRAFIEELYKCRNAYVGDISANGKILNLLKEYYGVSGMGGVELQTYAKPYWFTLSFDTKPDDINMWKLAAVFLALTENCSEFRWEFTAENNREFTYYVCTEDVEVQIGCEDLKAYSSSAEKLAELLALLEENVTGRTEQIINAEYVINKNISYSCLKEAAKNTEISWSDLNRYEQRLITDGAMYRGFENKAAECFYEDFDASGTMDFILHVQQYDEEGDADSVLYIYMNEEPLYVYKTAMYCWNIDISSGDIDRDGNAELVYIGFTGGNGGSGSHEKGILKYENQTFSKMQMPCVLTEKSSEWEDAGYHLKVYWGTEENTYRVVCEALGIEEMITSEYLKDENGKLLRRPVPDSEVGGNVRGFYRFEVIEKDGMDYLIAEEYFHGEGGVNHGLGYVRFIFDREDTAGWIVKEYEVIPYNYL